MVPALRGTKREGRDEKLFRLEHNNDGDTAVASDEKLCSCHVCQQQQHGSPVEAAATRSLLDDFVRSINIDDQPAAAAQDDAFQPRNHARTAA